METEISMESSDLDKKLKTKSSYRISKQGLINFLFLVIVFLVTRQVPFSVLSPIMNLAVVLIITLSLSQVKPNKKMAWIVCVLLILPLSCNLLYSVALTDNKLILGIKFYIVLLSVGLAYFVRVDRVTLKWFVGICLLQVMVILGIYIFVITVFDINTYLPLRLFFIEQGWGDIYTYDGFFYRIQIKGSALLVIALILNLEMELFKNKYTVSAFLLTGIVVAGNFAFLISLAIYAFYKMFALKYSKSINTYKIKVGFFILILVLISPYVFQYVSSTIERKSDNSLSLRGDQVDVLMNNLSENHFTLLLGQGLGNTLNIITSSRDYTDSVYFEIQILYILNQLGMLFFVFFFVYNIVLVVVKWGKHNQEIYITYLIYIVYAVTNPYIFDTNHLVVIIILNSWVYIKRKIYEEQRSSINCCTLQS